jgi:hypothetical protein
LLLLLLLALLLKCKLLLVHHDLRQTVLRHEQK